MEFVFANWEWFLLGLFVLEKVVKITPFKQDDVIFDMVIKPVWNKFFVKKTT